MIGCENLPQKESSLVITDEPKESIAISECNTQCSTDTLKKALSSLLSNSDGLAYFVWLEQSIEINGKEILTLLLN